MWDTSRTQDPVLAQTGMSADSHREPVYQVEPSRTRTQWNQNAALMVLLCCCGAGPVLLAGVLGSVGEERRVWSSEFQFWRRGSAVDGGAGPRQDGSGRCVRLRTAAGSPQQRPEGETRTKPDSGLWDKSPDPDFPSWF